MEYLSAQIKMADASSSGEEIEENPMGTAISRGVSLSEAAKASISRKRKIIVNNGKYKASREHNFWSNFLALFWFWSTF